MASCALPPLHHRDVLGPVRAPGLDAAQPRLQVPPTRHRKCHWRSRHHCLAQLLFHLRRRSMRRALLRRTRSLCVKELARWIVIVGGSMLREVARPACHPRAWPCDTCLRLYKGCVDVCQKSCPGRHTNRGHSRPHTQPDSLKFGECWESGFGHRIIEKTAPAVPRVSPASPCGTCSHGTRLHLQVATIC